MEQCVHALKMRALRPLRETTYLRVEVHVTAYVAPAVADAPQRYIRHAHVRRASVRGAGERACIKDVRSIFGVYTPTSIYWYILSIGLPAYSGIYQSI